MAFELPKLPFPVDALEPYMSKRTLEFHYGKHHQGYVNNLNSLVSGTEFGQMDLESIMDATFTTQKKIYNNAAQHWNHTFFWSGLSNSKTSPSTELESALERYFDSLDQFRQEFAKTAKEVFGSGWAWLVKDSSSALKVCGLPNGENPLQHGLLPLLTCDVWEHAYYLDYQNDRPKYLDAFWKIVNWVFVQDNFEKDFGHVPGPKTISTAHATHQ